MNSETTAAISSHLTSKSLPPTQSWLQSYLDTARPTTPLPALKQTALFRIQASDITTSIDKTKVKTFPSDIHNAQIRERKLKGNILVQLLDVEDVGRSRWSQIEDMEAAERGEGTKGREIVRTVPEEDDTGGTSATASALSPSAKSTGPHKLLLQDSNGTMTYAFESNPIGWIDLDMNIGLKMLIKEASVARGVVLLQPSSTENLGGKIESQQKAWREGRKARLTAAVETTDEPELNLQ